MTKGKEISLPLNNEAISSLSLGDTIYLSGSIYTGRDAVLPKLVSEITAGTYDGPSLEGSAIFHTAVSTAGIGPTSSNKLEIEESIIPLSKAGVKLHLGKGSISPETVKGLGETGSVYAITPPVTALFMRNTLSKKAILHQELGMEAMHELQVVELPVIIASIRGFSIYEMNRHHD